MKELTRLVLYTAATAAIILFVIFMARFDNESGTFLVSIGEFMVVVLPVAVGILMARRERARHAAEGGDKDR